MDWCQPTFHFCRRPNPPYGVVLEPKRGFRLSSFACWSQTSPIVVLGVMLQFRRVEGWLKSRDASHNG